MASRNTAMSRQADDSSSSCPSTFRNIQPLLPNKPRGVARAGSTCSCATEARWSTPGPIFGKRILVSVPPT